MFRRGLGQLCASAGEGCDYAAIIAGTAFAFLSTSAAIIFYRDPRGAARAAKWPPVIAFVYGAMFAAGMALPIWGGRTAQEAYVQGNRLGNGMLIILAHLIVLLAVAASCEALSAWRHRYWGPGKCGFVARAHYTALALAARAPVPLFVQLNLVGWYLP